MGRASVAPGWLRTDLGGPNAPGAVESVLPGAMVPVLANDGKSGQFIQAANYLTVLSAAMVASYFLIGMLATTLARRGIRTVHLLGGGLTMALLTLMPEAGARLPFDLGAVPAPQRVLQAPAPGADSSALVSMPWT